jgi:DNA-directed RNA polymerase subunit RPC12/RpoP
MEAPDQGRNLCVLCDREFPTRRGLASHEKSHMEPIPCPQCGRLVRYLFPHMKEHAAGGAWEDGVKALVKELSRLREEVRRLSS